MDAPSEMEESGEWLAGLYREAGPGILSYLAQKLGDQSAAEDLLQETFVAALKHEGRVRAAVSPRAYLFGTARNLALSALRRRAGVEPFMSDSAVVDEAPPDPRLEGMREALARLKPAFREVLELRLQHELTYEEIATTVGVPVGTVRSRLHNAVNELRSAMTRFHPQLNPKNRRQIDER